MGRKRKKVGLISAVSKFSDALRKHEVSKTLLPSIHIWLIYVLLFLIFVATLGVILTGLIFVLGTIFGWAQKEEVKEAFRVLWYDDLPVSTFHLPLIIIESLALLIFSKFIFPKIRNLIVDLTS